MAVDLIRSTTPQAAPLKPPSCAHAGNPRDVVSQEQAGNKDQVLVHQRAQDAQDGALCAPTQAMPPDEHSQVKPLSLEDDRDAVAEADAMSPYIQRLLGRALLVRPYYYCRMYSQGDFATQPRRGAMKRER